MPSGRPAGRAVGGRDAAPQLTPVREVSLFDFIYLDTLGVVGRLSYLPRYVSTAVPVSYVYTNVIMCPVKSN